MDMQIHVVVRLRRPNVQPNTTDIGPSSSTVRHTVRVHKFVYISTIDCFFTFLSCTLVFKLTGTRMQKLAVERVTMVLWCP